MWGSAVTVVVAVLLFAIYRLWLAPTHILVVNALDAQRADFILNNDSRHIHIDCISMSEVDDLSGYDAIFFFGRTLYLDERQMAEVERVAAKGVPIFTKVIRNGATIIQRNLTDEQIARLEVYFDNTNHSNFRNGLRYLRHIATPQRWGDQDYEEPQEIPANLFYHREYGQYFQKHKDLTEYLKKKEIYHAGAKNIALISGIQFPMEGNRQHVDTLISLLTERGYNVYPLTAMGKPRTDMLQALHPDAVVYMAMGRLGDDDLIDWFNQENIPVFSPFPVSENHERWLDPDIQISNGSLNARVVIPEIDGGVAPYAIATQQPNAEGFFTYTIEPERIEAFLTHLDNYMKLGTLPNSEKRIAIGYFKRPGKDALLASGMEVIPSLYHFLKRLRSEGYNVEGLPSTEEAFARTIKTEGIVLGSYARGAQEQYMREGNPVWIDKSTYEQWAHQVLLPEKYQEVVDRYGDAPGSLLSRGDSIAVACVRYGNVLLFPQPRPALGDDDFKLVHGAKVAPPHSYLAPYLYVQLGFRADALIHFGTHGNLEYTPGKAAALSQADWSEALVGNLPHFYYYTTGNVGEGVIAKRRTHAVLATYLTPPYAESGMRQQLSPLLTRIHRLLEGEGDAREALALKQEVVKLGYHRDLGLDSLLTQPYTEEQLEQLDSHLEEVANEKMQGAYYVLGRPYNQEELLQTTLAISADAYAYAKGRADRDKGLISTEQLQDYAYVSHHYLPEAKREITALLARPSADTTGLHPLLKDALAYRRLLLSSTQREIDAMLCALNGGRIAPAPGGDPVMKPNVLPTGRNMFSVNPELTPTEQSWEDGKRLGNATIERYLKQHGEYPHKVSYTFWAGEFISTQGATVAQALWMLGVEPVRDGQGRISDLRLIPSEELQRPRINVVVQSSGQLRDIAASRFKLITEAVKLASEAGSEEAFPNYVAQGTLSQEKELLDKGLSPLQARELSVMRVFGPLNSGYSTGMMGYIESSGTWDKESELAQGYLNNMGAIYGDEEHWGDYTEGLFASALQQTDVVIQPRQSNTWGPVTLDHVYEFTGGLSLTVKELTGKEPDAYMADYRNRSNRRLQDAREAVAVEMRSSILNPVYVKERMKGDEGTAQMFGEVFRNIFGWSVTRPTTLDERVYDDLYDMYMVDKQGLGIRDYFQRTNPAAFQAMTSVMMESARKGYWNPTEEQLKAVANLHAEITHESGVACTEFVCNNDKLQAFIAQQLSAAQAQTYGRDMDAVKQGADGQRQMVLKSDHTPDVFSSSLMLEGLVVAGVLVLLLVVVILMRRRRS